MSTVIIIDGGAGRVLTSIPSLLKYHYLNPNKEWYICVHAWADLFWSIPELQHRVYPIDQKNIFNDVFLKADEVIRPEPYQVPDYYKQKISLAEAFDREINKTTDHSDLPPPVLALSIREKASAINFFKELSQRTGKSKNIIIQPYGSTATAIDGQTVVDETLRSFPSHIYYKIVDELYKDYNLIYFGEANLDTVGTPTEKPQLGLRQWASLIAYSDYFVGCDSVGQHMARAFNKKATIVYGSTSPINTSYPKAFNIYQKNVPFYSPLRLTPLDANLSDRLNEYTSWTYTDDEIVSIVNEIKQELNYEENTGNGSTGSR